MNNTISARLGHELSIMDTNLILFLIPNFGSLRNAAWSLSFLIKVHHSAPTILNCVFKHGGPLESPCGAPVAF